MPEAGRDRSSGTLGQKNMSSSTPTVNAPSYYFLVVASILSGVAYPSITWLPTFIESHRSLIGGSVALLPANMLFCRDIGVAIAFLAFVHLLFFGLSFRSPRFSGIIPIKIVSLVTVAMLSAFTLLLFTCLLSKQ